MYDSVLNIKKIIWHFKANFGSKYYTFTHFKIITQNFFTPLSEQILTFNFKK